VKIYPYTDDPYKFEDFEYLLIGDKADKHALESARVHKNMVLVKFAGLNTIEAVTPLMNQNVYIAREDVEDDGEGHYIVDLIGCEVYDQNDALIGILKDVLQNTAQDIYEIKRKDNGKMLYVPVVDAFVKAIDVDRKRIDVHLIEGMIE
jgi:16S rRNA processing protein RimM